MTTVNHECYVSLEVAKLLKEAGFDWECREYYYNFTTTGWSLSFDDDFVNWNSWSEQYISAPTLDVAQRWLREVKGWDILIRQFEFNKRQKEDGSWEYPYLCELHTKYGKHETFAGYTDAFYKYEEAQEAGIKKALEMILEKGE